MHQRHWTQQQTLVVLWSSSFTKQSKATIYTCSQQLTIRLCRLLLLWTKLSACRCRFFFLVLVSRVLFDCVQINYSVWKNEHSMRLAFSPWRRWHWISRWPTRWSDYDDSSSMKRMNGRDDRDRLQWKHSNGVYSRNLLVSSEWWLLLFTFHLGSSRSDVSILRLSPVRVRSGDWGGGCDLLFFIRKTKRSECQSIIVVGVVRGNGIVYLSLN